MSFMRKSCGCESGCGMRAPREGPGGAQESWSTKTMSERRDADGASGAFDGDGKADADERAVLGRVEQRGDDADDLAIHGHERAPPVSPTYPPLPPHPHPEAPA